MPDLLAYGSYLPYWRLTGESICTVLGGRAGNGSRAVASYDEDTTTMAVAAARRALATGEAVDALHALGFVSSSPTYVDKTNATGIHAALGLPLHVRCSDLGGAARTGLTALISALHSTEKTLLTVADTRTGPAGSSDESAGGDAAVAFVVGEGPGIATLLGTGSVSEEFLDRWREPGQPWAQTWEERFGESIYLDLAGESFAAALKDAGVQADDVDRLAVTGLSSRAAAQFARTCGVDRARIASDLVDRVGNTGAAHPGLLLAAMLDEAEPDETIAVTMLADGADTLILRATDQLVARRQPRSVSDQIADGNPELRYGDFLSWKGQLQRQAPRRPDPDRAAAPPARRRASWKFGFVGSECNACGTRHLPPQAVCLTCGATGDMSQVRLADTSAEVATFTIDHLAFSPAPPVIGVVLDFEGGARFSCELTDADPATVAIGQRVEMTFRRISLSSGIHNYFWKARPLSEGAAS